MSSQSSRGPSSSKSDRGKKKQKQTQHKKKMSASHSSEPAEVILDICDSDVESDETLWDLYERWITHWKLSRSVDEKNERFPTFKKHAKHIHMENEMNRSACKLVLNPNSDMTMEEFENDFQNQRRRFEHIEIQDKDMESDDTLWDLYERWMIHYEQPRSLDEKNMRFGAFKEQVQYIHLHNKKDNMAYKLGLNQYSDMSKDEFESKFMGGSHPKDVLRLYRMLREMGGICTKEIDGRRVKVGEVKMLKHNDEEALEAAVRMHPIIPITVWVDSRGNAFKNYRGGVLTEEVGKEPLQEVTLTGFGVTPDGVKYWEIKNTWSKKWGANGFMRIKRGVNLCGIAGYGCIALLD